MTNNAAGAKKARETAIRNAGGEEAFKQLMRERASKGGKSPHSFRGFRDVKGLADEAARKSAEVRKKRED